MPNGNIIDEEMVMKGMQDWDSATDYFLDTQTGEIVFISNAEEHAKSRLKEMDRADGRYEKIPQLPSHEQHTLMKGFIEEFVKHEEFEEDDHLSKKLLIALNGKEAFISFKDVLAKAENGWLGTWYQWSSEYVYEEMHKWLDSLPMEITDEWEAGDDCAVCQAMNGSTEDLLKAFDEQNAKNGKLVKPQKKKLPN